MWISHNRYTTTLAHTNTTTPNTTTTLHLSDLDFHTMQKVLLTSGTPNWSYCLMVANGCSSFARVRAYVVHFGVCELFCLSVIVIKCVESAHQCCCCKLVFTQTLHSMLVRIDPSNSCRFCACSCAYDECACLPGAPNSPQYIYMRTRNTASTVQDGMAYTYLWCARKSGGTELWFVSQEKSRGRGLCRWIAATYHISKLSHLATRLALSRWCHVGGSLYWRT